MRPKIVCVIPARLNSTRFPRKMLALLQDKPLLQWAWESASQISLFDKVVVAVDSEELKNVVTAFGGEAFLTSPHCQNGTERLIELHRSGRISGDIWVNWQGDQPQIAQETISSLLQTCHIPDEEIWTLKCKIKELHDIISPHVVKVICDKGGNALYFSRSPIPFNRDASPNATYYKHVGLYAFSSTALDKIASLSSCEIEECEKLEQLRFLHHGLSIRVHEVHTPIYGVDTVEELSYLASVL